MRSWKNASRGNLALLLDTHAILWIATAPERIPAAARREIELQEDALRISAVTAWEYSELNDRLRFGHDLPLGPIVDRLKAEIIDFPADAWRLAGSLPPLHRDPVDRMLIAHALQADLSLITADATIRRYPVRTLW